MNKKNNNKGFTLAELLIVVAIIAVLVAIAIPVFTTQLEKSREATDLANIRSAYAEVIVQAIDNDSKTSKEVTMKQTVKEWVTKDAKTTLQSITGSTDRVSGEPESGGKATITWNPQSGTTEGYASIVFSK